MAQGAPALVRVRSPAFAAIAADAVLHDGRPHGGERLGNYSVGPPEAHDLDARRMFALKNRLL